MAPRLPWVLTAKLLLFDILLPVLDKVFDGLNIKGFYDRGDYYWMACTASVIALPGAMEALIWILDTTCLFGQSSCWMATKWFLCFGPLTFPIGTIVWYGENNIVIIVM